MKNSSLENHELFPSSDRKQPGKPIYNVCLKVLLPVLILLTILVMVLSYRMVWKACNDVAKADQEIAESGILNLYTILEAEEENYYYEVFQINDREGNYIAFRVTGEERNLIPCLAGSYYPTAYWYGDYQIMDLSQNYSVIDNSYWAYTEAYLFNLDQVKVYDFSAYKGHTQALGRGGGLMLVFLWLVELLVAGILISLDLIAGLILFSVNRKRARSQQMGHSEEK